METISFVIPVYNEEKRLSKTFKALESFLLPNGLVLDEIIFVDDGSKDKTLRKLYEWRKTTNNKVVIVSYPKNQGKGWAIKQGMLRSSSDYSLFFDADISTPLSEIQRFLPLIKKNIDVLVGTRKNGKSTVIKHQPFLREALGRTFTHITKIILGVNFTDFTCGFKAFSRNARLKIFSLSKIKTWGFDAEILLLAQKFNLSTQEKAVLWANDEGSKVKLHKAIPQTLRDLIQIYFEHRVPLFRSLPKSTFYQYDRTVKV